MVQRIETAREVSLAALHAADAELERNRAHRRSVASLAACCGVIGLAGLASIIVVGAPQVPAALTSLFAVAGSIPIVMCVRRTAGQTSREAEIVAAIEYARAVAFNAASLRDALNRLPASEAELPGTKALIDTILTDVERSAAAAPGREQRMRGAAGEQGRRHVRIKPINDRVVITRNDGLAIIAQLVDVSMSGAAISGDLPDVIAGDQVLVGSRMARVIRTLPHGIACEFVKELPPAALDFDIVL